MGDIILYIMVLFSIIGGVDKLLGNRHGLGEKFDEAFRNMGGLTLSMVGIISLAPFISQILSPVLMKLSNVTGADPSIFISSILATDLGGYTSSVELAQSQKIAEFSGLILASTMGVTISFIIPVAVNLIPRDDFHCFAKGILSGIITIPIGMVIGGAAMGISLDIILINLLPVLILSIIIGFGLFKYQDKTLYIFNILGKSVVVISTIGLLISILDFILGIKLIPNMIPFEEAFIIVGKTTIIISGAYPLFYFLSNKFGKHLNKLSSRLGINEFSTLGLMTSLANAIPTMGIYGSMDNKGKILNAAFMTSGAFTFGGQLAYVSSMSKDIITPFLLAKLSGGILSVVLASLIFKIDRKET
jgi:ethanolamine transporter